MGVLVFVTAISRKNPDRSIHILKAEMPGPTMDKIVPRSGDTAKILYLMYFAMTVVTFVLLLFGGMNVFDGLSRGDVIRYSCDLSGNVAYVKPYFRSAAPPKQKQGTESASGSVNITSDFCTVYGRVTDKNEGFITVSLPDNPSDMPAAAVYPTESAWVYLFDSADARVSVVSAGDIEVGDMVFMRSQTTVVRDLIIVR